MEIFREYASGIIVVSVLAILLENILPQSHHKKYINITIGLVVMLAIINPLTNMAHYRTAFVLPETLIDDSDLSANDDKRFVRQEFAERLSNKLSSEVKARCGATVNISVEIEANRDGEITGIGKVRVYPLNEDIRSVILECTGLSENVIEEGNAG